MLTPNGTITISAVARPGGGYEPGGGGTSY